MWCSIIHQLHKTLTFKLFYKNLDPPMETQSTDRAMYYKFWYVLLSSSRYFLISFVIFLWLVSSFVCCLFFKWLGVFLVSFRYWLLILRKPVIWSPSFWKLVRPSRYSVQNRAEALSWRGRSPSGSTAKNFLNVHCFVCLFFPLLRTVYCISQLGF